MGIPADVVEDLCRSGERPLGVDHPFGVPNRRQIAPECRGLMQVAVRGEEVQLASGEGLLKVAQEQAPEHPRQHPDRQEEPWSAGDPALLHPARCRRRERENEYAGDATGFVPRCAAHRGSRSLRPDALGSAAMVRNVSDAARNRMS